MLNHLCNVGMALFVPWQQCWYSVLGLVTPGEAPICARQCPSIACLTSENLHESTSGQSPTVGLALSGSAPRVSHPGACQTNGTLCVVFSWLCWIEKCYALEQDRQHLIGQAWHVHIALHRAVTASRDRQGGLTWVNSDDQGWRCCSRIQEELLDGVHNGIHEVRLILSRIQKGCSAPGHCACSSCKPSTYQSMRSGKACPGPLRSMKVAQ
jgi:hypothetical protein